MVDACCHGDITVALYPFKNIYCYVCNTDGPVRNPFFLNVVSRFLFQYYVFNISEGYDSYTVNNDTQSSQYNQPHDNEYHKWDMKMNCGSLLPISMLETEPLSTLDRLAIKVNCTVYTIKEENHSNLPDVEGSAISSIVSQCFTDINLPDVEWSACSSIVSQSFTDINLPDVEWSACSSIVSQSFTDITWTFL